MHYLVTGGAGFIGSHIVDHLISLGNRVTVYDNFSTGRREFLSASLRNPNLEIVEADLLDPVRLSKAMQGVDFVFHLAANADVRFGADHPARDLEQNTIGTFYVLEAMRKNGVKKIGFSSTGSIYGEAEVIPTPESAPFPIQTSLYGTSKLAGEGLISSYCEAFEMQSWIFRFVSILGERYSHGHVFDFYKQLLEHPKKLRVLGNGKQKKSYLYVGDCVAAIMCAIEKSKDSVNIFNLGTDEFIEVKDSIATLCGHLKLSPKLEFTGGDRGWIGDNPFIYLATSKIRQLGWKPKLSIQQGIIRTVDYLKENPKTLERPEKSSNGRSLDLDIEFRSVGLSSQATSEQPGAEASSL